MPAQPGQDRLTFAFKRSSTALDPVAAVEELLSLLPSGTTRLLGLILQSPSPGVGKVAVASDAQDRLAPWIRCQISGAAQRAGFDPTVRLDAGCWPT